jgi:predicted nuclease of predicted toxin-antitoxin system
MKNRIKFYLDEHVQKAIAKGLKRRGVDVITVVDADLLGATDEDHLERAKSEKRVVFTQDDDFLRLHAAGNEHYGIVYAHQGKAVGPLISGLMLIYQALEAEEMINHVEYL